MTGAYWPVIPYGWYPNSRLQVNYRQYDASRPQILDYNKSGNTYVKLYGDDADMIDFGGTTTNYLPLQNVRDMYALGFRWIWLWMSINQTAYYTGTLVKKITVWWWTSTGNVVASTVSYTSHDATAGNGYICTRVIPIMRQDYSNWYYSTMTVNFSTSSRIDVSLGGTGLWWAVDNMGEVG